MNNRKMIINRNETALKECFSGERHISVSPDKKYFIIERELFVNKEKERMPFIISITADAEKGLFYFDLFFGTHLAAFYEMVSMLCSKLSLTFSPYSFFVANNKMISRYTHKMSVDVINAEKIEEIINGFDRILKRSYACIRKVNNGILPDIIDMLRIDIDYIDKDDSIREYKEPDASEKETVACGEDCEEASTFSPFDCNKTPENRKPLVLNNGGNLLFDFEDDENYIHTPPEDEDCEYF